MNKTAAVLISLVVLFAFIAHEVLMSVGDRGDLSTVVGQQPSTVQGTRDSEGDVLLSLVHGRSSLAPLAAGSQASRCTAPQPVTLPSTAVELEPGVAIVPEIWAPEASTIYWALPYVVVPGYPAGVRRAFLQVYRN